jgi:hypothetical protein
MPVAPAPAGKAFLYKNGFKKLLSERKPAHFFFAKNQDSVVWAARVVEVVFSDQPSLVVDQVAEAVWAPRCLVLQVVKVVLAEVADRETDDQ